MARWRAPLPRLRAGLRRAEGAARLETPSLVTQVNAANLETDVNFGTLEGSSIKALSRILAEVRCPAGTAGPRELKPGMRAERARRRAEREAK